MSREAENALVWSLLHQHGPLWARLIEQGEAIRRLVDDQPAFALSGYTATPMPCHDDDLSWYEPAEKPEASE